MSLTRTQWLELWDAIDKLDRYVYEGIPPHSGYRKAARAQVARIKKLVESVIGQME